MTVVGLGTNWITTMEKVVGARSARTKRRAPDDVPPVRIVESDSPLPEWRARLKPVVLDAFSDTDFHRVDMRSIADRAGMSLHTIYRHFGDKEKLLFAFIDDWLIDLRDEVAKALKGLESPREKLRKTLWCHLDYYQRNPKVGRALFMTVPMHTWMDTETFARRDFITLLIGVIREGQKDGAITNAIPIQTILDLLVGALVRAFVMWQYRKEEYALTEQLDPLFRLLWNGMTGAGGSAHEGSAPSNGTSTRLY